MLTLFALSIAAAPALDSPAQRVDPGAAASFTATATILRGAGVGHGKNPPKDAQAPRETMVEDAAGQPHPAIITDFE